MKELKSPVYLYDEPAEYNDFTGGMNTSKNDLGLLSNQIKLGLNLDYDERNLVVRTGGKEFVRLSEQFKNIQGVFIFSANTKYMVVADDGKLYYGVYEPNSTIQFNYLPILIKENELTIDSFKVSNGLLTFNADDIPTQNHDGYVENRTYSRLLVFQNKFKIEAAQYKNILYITTGTRLVEVTEEYSGKINASIVSPYKPSSIEYSSVGPNLLSYIPSVHIETESKGIRTAINNVIPLKQTNGRVKMVAVMTYADGEGKNDYRFKWERTKDGTNYEPCQFNLASGEIYVSKFSSNYSFGLTEFEVSEESALAYTYRCSFAISFKTETKTDDWLIENGDWVIDKVDGYWFGQATSIKYTPTLYTNSNEYYRQIQTCKKIFGYGNKFLLYDDAYNSGNMWKTVIDNPYYVSYKGGLNFKTDKDEQITRIVNFKGILVAFSYNEILGGNISVVSGNGDDYNDGSNYSPFSKRIVNKVISTDNPYSVQIAENVILFKHKESIFMISGSNLNYEIVDYQEINTYLKQENLFIKIPFDDNDCISELTDNYYGLYWKDKYDKDNNLIHPAYRLKMYYKNAFTESNRIYFPSLLDTSELFRTDFIIQIAEKNYVLYNNILVSFNEKYYLDLNKPYEYDLVTKGFELNYPQFIKSVKKVMFTYSNDETTPITIAPKIYNESMYEILKSNTKVFENNVLGGKDSIIKTDSLITSYLLVTPSLREDCMNATVRISGTAQNYLCINSITFFYKTKSIPKKSPIENYKKIIRKGERLVK